MALVTLDEAKTHLHIDLANLDSDTDVELKRQAASHIVLDYLKVADDYWTDSNGEPVDPPYLVKAATLLVLGALFENREGAESVLTQAVKDLLRRYRDPALA